MEVAVQIVRSRPQRLKWMVLSLTLGFVLSDYSWAKEMPATAQRSVKAYGLSAHIKEPTLEYSQRYGAALMLQDSLPGRMGLGGFAGHSGYALWFHATPEFEKQTPSVSITQDFYSLAALAQLHYTWLFRFSVLAGPGLLWSKSNYDILGKRMTHGAASALGLAAVLLDYAVSDRVEISYIVLGQYRFPQRKDDWLHGLGISFNF